MKRERAEKLADKVISRLFDYWEIAAVAGSIRRRKPEVRDIEIVMVPHRENIEKAVKDIGLTLKSLETLNKVKILKNGPKYKQFWLTKKDRSHIIKVDLFLVTPPAQLPVILTIRTGSAKFSKWIVNVRKDRGFTFSKGGLYLNGEKVGLKTELQLFETLGIRFITPKEREPRIDFSTLLME